MTDVAILGELAYWQQTGIRVGAGLAAVLLVAGTLVYLHLFKLVSFMQSRLGPMEAGPFGSLQLLAEVGKFLQKEDIFPRKADRFVFAAAPFVVLMSTFLLVVVVPGGPDAWFINSELGIYLAMAVSSVSVIGILMAGWGSASKYSLLGGLRATGQLIAYELPLILAVMGVVIQAETMNMQGIVQAQADGEIFGWGGIGNPYILTQFVAFVIFMIAMQAELTQTPFDMPIAESELVTGYMTEYSGMRFLLFFIGEFATAGVFSAIASVLFLGGWWAPIPGLGFDDNVWNLLGPLVLVTKVVVLTFIIFWARFSLPRFREDQLQQLAWKVLIPLALANIVVTALLKIVF
ncbi:MAG: NADH-quinone oxidoreductase subunit H [Acidimicrobiaceae bacterium]|nr:NADH-quinone oxidoreductase subunit H [Acidimicrobiaceae bacterium]HAB57149.1 NADH-quinone oxidoreductase subunit H [Acidimicrobiaceae bacterium]